MSTTRVFSNRTHGLEERLSYIHSAGNYEAEKDIYAKEHTPGELDDGAIVKGGAVSIVSTEAMALFA
ncbi:unnamed protein product, partial [Aphanomyces euteiches]